LLTSKHGQRLIEHRLAIDASFQPCAYFDKKVQVWCRTQLDVGLIGTNKAVVIDWKTGKRKPDSEQLMHAAAMVFAHFPFLEEVHVAFVWLPDRKLDSDKFTREQVSQIWNVFLPRVRRLEIAHETNRWQAKPSGLCGKWCPVTRQHCEYGR
jgi:hypothetical protein